MFKYFNMDNRQKKNAKLRQEIEKKPFGFYIFIILLAILMVVSYAGMFFRPS